MGLLEQSLCLLDGISESAESKFRGQGYLTMHAVASAVYDLFSHGRAERVLCSYDLLTRALKEKQIPLIVGNLPCGHRVRALHDFYDRVLFFDIETDGVAANSHITCITGMMNGEVRQYVRGRNLNGFLKDWFNADIVVGFNSRRFDVPIILREFGIDGMPPQVDLMHEAAHFGLRGGLKAIEKQIGFSRTVCECSDGTEAVQMWHRYQNEHDQNALEYLLAYNMQDVLALEALYRWVLDKSLDGQSIPFVL